VVCLRSGPLAPYEAAADGFRQAATGDVIDLSLSSTSPDQIERQLVALRPDAVVAVGLRAAIFVRDRLPRVPLVFCVVQNFEDHDLEGTWITGVSTDIAPEDELGALAAAAPDVRRVAVFFGAESGGKLARRARLAAHALGLTLEEAPVSGLADLPRAARAVSTKVDAFWMPADAVVATPEAFRFLLRFSLDSRKPLLAFSESLVRAGAFAGLSPDYNRAGALAAEAVRRIRAGERAGDIPVAHVPVGRVVVNGSTARALGREVPGPLLRRAEILP